jgi:hypothetical protein
MNKSKVALSLKISSDSSCVIIFSSLAKVPVTSESAATTSCAVPNCFGYEPLDRQLIYHQQ